MSTDQQQNDGGADGGEGGQQAAGSGEGGDGGAAGGEGGQQGAGSRAADFMDGDEGGGQQGGGSGEGGEGGGKPWYDALAGTEPIDDKGTLSADWLAKKGFKSFDDMTAKYREMEGKLYSGDKLVVPGEDASDEERESFFKAIGRPDEAAGYELETPEGVGLNEPMIDALRDEAFNLGVPKAMYEGLGKALIDFQLGEQLAHVEKQEGLGRKWEGEQDDLALSRRLMNAGAKALGLSKDDITEMDLSLQNMGRDRLYEMLKKVGTVSQEDVFLQPGAGENLFGVTGPEAQKQLDALNKDEAWRKKISAGDATAIAQRDRLIKAIAAHEAQQNAQAA
jgi:hypothetical protein